MFEKAVQLVQQGVTRGVFPSAALAIGIRNEILVRDAWGMNSLYAPNEPVDPHTLYDIASLSKVVATSTIAFHFIEEGLLSLGDPVGLFFPDAPQSHQNITIFHLMTHTSGMPAHLYLSELCEDPAAVAHTLMQIPLKHQTGTQTEYSCLGYILLGKILEQIAGAPLDALAQRHVFDPLRMSRTTYHPRGSIAYTERDEHGQWLHGVVHDENARFLGGISGNAGVFSCLDDMIQYTTMLACQGFIHGTHFLSPAMLKAAAANHTPGLSEYRGLGFQHIGGNPSFFGELMGENTFGHTGFTGTSIAIDPCSGLHVVLLTNRVHPTRENTQLLRFRRLLHNSIAAEYARHYPAAL